MIKAGVSFSTLPALLKKDVIFCEAAICKNPESHKLISDELWANKELSLKFLISSNYHHNNEAYFKTCSLIEGQHQDDEDIIYYLVKNNYPIKDESKFFDVKRIVEVLLKNSDSWSWNHLETLEKYKKISSRLKKDKDIVSLVLKINFPLFYPEIDDSLKSDLPLLKGVIYSKSQFFEDFPEKLKDNKDIAKTAIRRRGNCYLFVSKRLKKDKEIVNLTLTKKPGMFKYFPRKYREDFNIALTAIKQDYTLIKHVDEKIRASKTFIKKAILCGASLKYASTELKKNKEIVKLATEQYNSNLFYAHSEIKKNKQFLLDNFPLYLVFIYCSKTILQDKEIFVKGLNLDTRLIMRRKMSASDILKMNYEGVKLYQRTEVFKYYKKVSKEKDIFLLANAKSIICGSE